MLDGVSEVLRVTEPYKLASRAFKPEGTVVTLGDVRIGGDEVIVMAGPCSAETRGAGQHDGRGREEGRREDAARRRVQAAQLAVQLPGPRRRRPADAARRGQSARLKLVSEVMDISQIEVIDKYCDMFQLGARNMQNFTLLRELGRTRKAVLLKRGIAATIEEWLLSAEYILSGGNSQVVLCERGIRTFENYTRNTLDISAIPVVKKLSHLPIIADPSHGTGRRDKVAPMARAAVAAGADGVIIEVHNDPDHALSDGAQSMFPAQFDRLMAELRIIAPAIGRTICLEPVMRRGAGERDDGDFRRIAIVGVGLIGGSVAFAARRVFPGVAVVGVDRDDVVTAARQLGAVTVRQRRISTRWPVRISSCWPRRSSRTSQVLGSAAGASSPGRRSITDAGSTKRATVEAARALPERLQFVGGHPLAGAARGGIEASRPDLFERRPWVLTPDLATPRATVERLAGFVRALGGSPFELDRRDARSRPRVHQSPAATHRERADARRRRSGRRERPAAVGRRPRRHDTRRGQPGPHLERHLRDQRGRRSCPRSTG